MKMEESCPSGVERVLRLVLVLLHNVVQQTLVLPVLQHNDQPQRLATMSATYPYLLAHLQHANL
jgi:hypothetical protein